MNESEFLFVIAGVAGTAAAVDILERKRPDNL